MSAEARTLTADELDRLDYAADMQKWATAGDPPWDYYPDAMLTSAYAEYVRLLTPDTVLALVSMARAALRAVPA